MRLKSLSVENFILVKKADLEFCPGFNVLTGETGAGKTMLLTAIAGATGSRIDWEVFGQQRALIRAVFQDGEAQTVVVRELAGKSRRSRIWMNGEPVSASGLFETMSRLIAVHGQRENQKLLDENQHLFYLDAFGGLVQEREDFARLWAEKQSLEAELKNLEHQLDQLRQARQLHEFQLKEIEQADIRPNEEQELRERRRLLLSAVEMAEAIAGCISGLQDDEGSALERISWARSQIERFSDTSAVSDILEALSGANELLLDALRGLASLADSLEHDPEELDRINQRLFTISRLKEKYKTDIEGLLALAERLRKQLEVADTGHQRVEALRARLAALREKMAQKAKRLSQARSSAARRLGQKVQEELAQLGMAGAVFQAEVRPEQEGPTGRDGCRFLLAANPGQPALPLVKVASGGELSRIMLALETGLANAENTPILIFDEVDQGIGGRVAEAVGRKLQELARNHQIITVTHLPQIAARAQRHFVVEKSGSTVNIRQLDRQQRVQEIARMSAGQRITPEAISLAKRLLAGD